MPPESKNTGALWRAALAKFKKDTPPDAILRGMSKIKTPLLKLEKRYSPATLARRLHGEPFNITITASELSACFKAWRTVKPKAPNTPAS